MHGFEPKRLLLHAKELETNEGGMNGCGEKEKRACWFASESLVEAWKVSNAIAHKSPKLEILSLKHEPQSVCCNSFLYKKTKYDHDDH